MSVIHQFSNITIIETVSVASLTKYLISRNGNVCFSNKKLDILNAGGSRVKNGESLKKQFNLDSSDIFNRACFIRLPNKQEKYIFKK